MFLHSLLDGWIWYPILFDTPLNAVRSVAIWLTLFALISYMIWAFLIKTEKRKRFFTVSIPFLLAYTCALCILFFTLSFYEDGIEPILFFPLLALLCAIAAGGLLLPHHPTRVTRILLYSLIGGAFLTTLVCLGVHFLSGDAAKNNWLTNEDVQSTALYIAGGMACALLLLIAFLCGKGESKIFDAKSVTYAAICIAMSFALSFMRLVRLPQGGSITPASLLPLMLYAYMFGVRKGIFAGFVYGLLQAFQDPTLLHPAQFLLDYALAFAWMGLAGLFTQVKALRKYPQAQFALGGILAGIGRFTMHFLSGTFAFGAFAPDGTPAALYSFLYQAGYVLPDLAIAITVGIALFSSKSFVKESRKFHLNSK